MKLSELREVAIMAACVDECNRAIEFNASLALSSLSDELVKKIKHEAGDLLAENLKAQSERRDEIEAPLREKLINNPSCQEEVDKEFAQLLSTDDLLQNLSKEESEIWDREVDFDYPIIEVPNQDFNASFPKDDKKEGSFLGYSWSAYGLKSFKNLIKKGIVKIVS